MLILPSFMAFTILLAMKSLYSTVALLDLAHHATIDHYLATYTNKTVNYLATNFLELLHAANTKSSPINIIHYHWQSGHFFTGNSVSDSLFMLALTINGIHM